ncbi:MAG: cytochrome c [Rhodospirillaceae bacterium]|nr:cytochrome c [Rhodospirillales bacterium]
MRAVLGVLVVLVVALVAMAAWLYSGSYDISARGKASPVLDQLTGIAKRQSVRAHAQHIDPPPLTDAILVEDGARHYRDACAQCHGAPGVEAQPFARNLRPAPPDLAKEPGGWTPSQLFWITQNGLRMTGMPAYQDALVDGEIWALVAFLDQLPKMDAAKYQSLTVPPAPPQVEPAPSGGVQDVVPPSEGEEPVSPSAPPSETPPAQPEAPR